MATVESPPAMGFAQTLRARMARLGLTEAEVSRLSGVAPRTIQGWLNEGRKPRAIQLLKVEGVLGDLSGLVFEEPERPPTLAAVAARLRAAQREIDFAKKILSQLGA